ncbi:molecular chaperone [Pseudescherichia sp.]|uniref:fimbrial biogenesis chaperone n=1 Tax=Pseudescherichia sp. TaxID=2055881 RepID=UPI0028A6787B|nr:molecular chaperone [Pseudescherichia sp.]
MSLSSRFNKVLFLGMCLLLNFSLADAAIQLQQTRLVYPVGKPSVSLVVKNSDTQNAVTVESWAESDRRDITITPVTMVIEPDSKRVLNIHIPARGHDDKQERLYWLNVKGTTRSGSHLPQQFSIAVINRIKVFYRPLNLFSGVASAYKKIGVSACRMQLTIKNPTPYYISFYSFKVDDEEVNGVRTIGPYEIQSAPLPTVKHNVARWQAILDTGFHSPSVSKKIKTNCSGY